MSWSNETYRKLYNENPEFRARKIAANKKWLAKNREHVRKKGKERYKNNRSAELLRGKFWRIKVLFNLSPEEYERIKQFQNDCCAICGRPLKRANTDHRHSDGLVRGLLCFKCNRMLGLAGDSTELLLKAVAYLKNPPVTQVLGEERYGLPGRLGTKKQAKLRKKLNKGYVNETTGSSSINDSIVGHSEPGSGKEGCICETSL